MQQLASFHIVDLETTTCSDEWNLHPFLPTRHSSPHLSIKRIGLLQPPIMQKMASGHYKLICGASRLRIFRDTHPTAKSIPCLIIAEKTSPKHVLNFVLEDQLLSGPLTPMEKAYFFNHCLKYMDIDAAANLFLPILCEKVQSHAIKKLLNLLRLETEIQVSVHNGQIGEKTAHELLSLNSTDRSSLHHIFMDLKLGGGKQKRLLTLTKDLAYREGCTVAELLATPEIQDILTHPEMNPPQKAVILLATLQKKLFPQSIAAEDSFAKEVIKMNLPPSCTVTHSQSFETDEVSLTVQFATLAEMEKHVATIRTLTQP